MIGKIAKQKQQSKNRLVYMDPPVHPVAALPLAPPPPAQEVAPPPTAAAEAAAPPAKPFVISEALSASDDEVHIVILSL